jgi:hypothetical protein
MSPTQKAPPPINLQGNVPILGRPQPIPYPIGGFALGFTVPPEEVAAHVSSAIQQGWTPGAEFLLIWQRTSMELGALKADNTELRMRIERLEAWLGIDSNAPVFEGAQGLEGVDLSAFGGSPGGEESGDEG